MAGFFGRGHARTQVFESRWQRKFDPRTGSAAIFVQSHVERTMAIAQRKAPRRSGELKNAHRTPGVLKVGALHARSYVYNISPHAKFVHDGTTGPIRSLSGHAMPIPSRRGGPRHPGGRLEPKVFRANYTPRMEVRGQRANPWLADAAREARKMVELDAALARARD